MTMQEELEKQLKTRWMGRKLFFREQTESTIIWAKEAAKQSRERELDGALFLADAQTGGREESAESGIPLRKRIFT